MNIEKKQIAHNKSARTATIKYIVIHDTQNANKGADAEAHFKYFNGGNRNSSADFFVDNKKILQINDYTKYATWQVGDGKGKYGIPGGTAGNPLYILPQLRHQNVTLCGRNHLHSAFGSGDVCFQKTIADLCKHIKQRRPHTQNCR